MTNKFLTCKELQERWRVSYETLWRWKKDGRIPDPIYIGGRMLFDLEDIERWEKNAPKVRLRKQKGEPHE